MVLYLVGTPIGNLGDVTLRALETLKEVDFIACEDTRKTGILLSRYGIRKPLICFYEHNEERAGKKVMSILREGKSVALVTNGGMPGISDPGFSLIRKAIGLHMDTTAIPGPTAFVMALVLSGLPTHSFVFRGFPPHKRGARRRFLEKDRDSSYTLIYYESPHRVKKFLEDAVGVFGDRQAALANELTKMFETILRGSLSRLLDQLDKSRIRGEYTIVIQGAKA